MEERLRMLETGRERAQPFTPPVAPPVPQPAAPTATPAASPTQEAPRFGSNFGGSSAGARQAAYGSQGVYSARDVQAEDYQVPNFERLDRAALFVSGVLSPVQATQDITFATLAGMMDEDKTIMEYLGELEWSNYTSWTPAPMRNVDGARLLSLAGVEDEGTKRWLGLGLDIFLDPLLGGMVVRSIGKAAKAPGLVRLGDFMDTAAEAPMLVGAIPTARVIKSVRALPGFKQVETAVMDNFVNRYALPVMQSVARATGVERALASTLPFSISGQRYNLAGMVIPDAGRMRGAQPITAEATALAEELGENTARLLMTADAAAGGTTWRSMLKTIQQSMAVMYDIPFDRISKLPEELTRSIITSAYSTVSDMGYQIARRGGMPAPTPSAPSPLMQRAMTELEEAATVMGRTRLTPEQARETVGRADHYRRERARIQQVAVKTGQDADETGRIYDEVVGRFTQLEAINGYFASGYGPLREKFAQELGSRLDNLATQFPSVARAVNRAGGAGQMVTNAWHDLLRAGARGEARDFLDRNVSFRGKRGTGKDGQFTYRQLFGEFAQIPGLDLGVFVDSLTKGHMRRTFGVFQDSASWKAAVDRIKDGRIASTRVLNEPAVRSHLVSKGFQAEFDVMESYLSSIVPKMYRNRPHGMFVRQKEVLTHMVKSGGVDGARAREFWKELVAGQDPHTAQIAARLEEYGRMHGGTIDPSQILGTPRQDLSRPELETLIELMNPIVSSAETAGASITSARRTEALTRVMNEGKKQGLIVDSRVAAKTNVPRWWVSIGEKEAAALPMLAGKTVHPMVHREFTNLLSLDNSTNAFSEGFARVRSMITGGYLASLPTTVANVAGGFFTAMQYGISPIKLANNMVEVYRDWKRLGPDLPDMANMRDIVQSGLAQNDLIRLSGNIPDAMVSDLRGGVRIISDALTQGVNRYQEFLRRPLGTRQSGALGLGMFEASESLFRLATYRMVMKETGGNIEEARRMARFVVFDYSAQPGLLKFIRNTGVMPFASFPYFMTGRLVNATFNRPGILAATERVPGAVTNLMFPDEDDRRAFIAGMEDWQIDDKWMPIRMKENGDVTILPFNQLLPTATYTGSPFADALRTAGLWGPLYDMLAAVGSLGSGGEEGTGSAVDDPGVGFFTGAYGRRVLPTGVTTRDDPEAVLKGVMSFMYNSFAPANVRRLGRAPEDVQQEWEGLIPQILRSTVDIPAEWADTGRTAQELARGRASQDLLDVAIANTVRSTSIVSTRGPTTSLARRLSNAVNRRDAELRRIDTKIKTLMDNGNMEEAERQQQLRDMVSYRFQNRWTETIEVYRRMAAEGSLY